MQGFNADWSGLLNSTARQSNMMVGLGENVKGFMDQKKAEGIERQEVELQKNTEDRAVELFKTGTPDEIAEFSLRNPQMGKLLEQQIGNKSSATRDNQMQSMRNIIANPANTEQILMNRAQMVKDAGGDPSQSLAQIEAYRQNPEAYADIVKKTYAFRDPKGYTAFAKATGQGGSGGAAETRSQSDFKYYQRLKKDDPEAAQQYGEQRGYLSKTGRDISVFQQKNLDAAQTAAISAGNDANTYDDLATQYAENGSKLGGGIFGSWKDGLKSATGSEDAPAMLRRKWIQIKNSEVIQNLPPGAASETDVDIIMRGYPSNDANPEQVANFLGAMSKIKKAEVMYNEFKSEYISEKGDTRGMIKAWKNLVKEQKLNAGSGSKDKVEAPPSAIEYLNKNPKMMGQFEAKYGYRPEGV